MATLLEMSLGGGCIILAAVLLRAAAKDRLPLGMFEALWALACLRLTVPVRLPFRLSAFTLLRRVMPHAAGTVSVPAAIAPGQTAPDLVDIIQATPQAAPDSPFPTMTVLWLAGAALCAGIFIVSYIRAYRRLRDAERVDSDYVNRFLAEHPLRRPVSVRASARVAAPLTYGAVRPVILLPRSMDLADGQTLGYVLTHELAHIRRFDAVRKPVLGAVACLHWFDPLVWVMLVLAGRDMERACDRAVVDAFGPDARRGYALALLALEERRGGLAPSSGFAKNAIEERIRSIMKIRPRSILSTLLALVLVSSVGAVFATAAPEDGAVIGGADGPTYISVTEAATLYADLVPGREGTFEDYFPLTEAEFAERCAVENPAWWTYEDYAVQAEKAKAHLETLVDRTVIEGGVTIHWSRSTVDAYAARFDAALAAIGRGLKLSWTEGCHLAEDPTGGTLLEMLLPPASVTAYDASLAEDVEWWTAEEYAAWLEQEKKDLQDCLGQRAWTKTDGWFTWTQERIDEAVEMYEQILEDIKNGLLVSKTVGGSDEGSMVLTQGTDGSSGAWETQDAAVQLVPEQSAAEE